MVGWKCSARATASAMPPSQQSTVSVHRRNSSEFDPARKNDADTYPEWLGGCKFVVHHQSRF